MRLRAGVRGYRGPWLSPSCQGPRLIERYVMLGIKSLVQGKLDDIYRAIHVAVMLAIFALIAAIMAVT
jgi:hypothetical protein